MLQNYTLRFGLLLAGLLTVACAREVDEPQPDSCNTSATIQYPLCNVLNCAQHPILLVLADGRQLKPSGAVWSSFWSNLGTPAPQRVRMSYQLLPTQAIYTWGNAEISCISSVQE
ncbi:hypothetical protein [Hymenobacter canadensis]|uniref:Lipoprotein n=1 Tax=Hymenobacter canadensis TaxID=2999067 RepID=A0ABY7LXA3_9BACT|nr:hypothetical protein [Hymenobacter canadensis]WBA43553.1 hypothetical protein O3303_08295 [Hymenobacter canadensis]